MVTNKYIIAADTVFWPLIGGVVKMNTPFTVMLTACNTDWSTGQLIKDSRSASLNHLAKQLDYFFSYFFFFFFLFPRSKEEQS